jgi:hypothetical protein
MSKKSMKAYLMASQWNTAKAANRISGENNFENINGNGVNNESVAEKPNSVMANLAAMAAISRKVNNGSWKLTKMARRAMKAVTAVENEAQWPEMAKI